MSLDLIMIVMTILPIVVGLLLGMLRGTRRSILRIILIIACVALAFFAKDAVSGAIVNVEINGTPMDQYIAQTLGEQFSGAQDILIAIAKCLINVFAFISVFLGLQFLTWIIVYPICKIFVKKGEKPRRLIGGAIGAVQGVVVALVLCIMFNGLFVNVGKITQATSSLGGVNASAVVASAEELGDGSGEGGQGGDFGFGGLEDMQQMFKDYNESGISNLYNSVGGWMFNLVAKTTVNEKEYTLEGQINALKAVVDMFDAISPYLDPNNSKAIDFSAGIKDCANQIKEMCDKLADINGNLTDESKETINVLVSTVASASGLDLDLSAVDFKTVDFAKEGQIIVDLAGYADKGKENITGQEVTKIVGDIFESDLIIAVLETSDSLDLKIPEDHKDLAELEIQKLEAQGKDANKIASLKYIFGITDNVEELPQEQPEA